VPLCNDWRQAILQLRPASLLINNNIFYFIAMIPGIRNDRFLRERSDNYACVLQRPLPCMQAMAVDQDIFPSVRRDADAVTALHRIGRCSDKVLDEASSQKGRPV
jgi:hypothetical protein